MSLPEQLAFLW